MTWWQYAAFAIGTPVAMVLAAIAGFKLSYGLGSAYFRRKTKEASC